jgi:hypothetical protein
LFYLCLSLWLCSFHRRRRHKIDHCPKYGLDFHSDHTFVIFFPTNGLEAQLKVNSQKVNVVLRNQKYHKGPQGLVHSPMSHQEMSGLLSTSDASGISIF